MRQGEVFGLPVEVDFLRHTVHVRQQVKLLDGEPVTRSYYSHNGWKPALDAAEVERKRSNGFHALRHHFASVLQVCGVASDTSTGHRVIARSG